MRIGNRFVGKVKVIGGERIFVTRRSEEKHLFRVFNGLGFNQSVVESLFEQDVWFPIWVYFEKKSGETVLLKTNASRVLFQGTEWNNKKDIKDTQVILPLEQFEVC